MIVSFQDFWESHGSDYFPELTLDVTKSFLQDLALKLNVTNTNEVMLTSVYRRVNFQKKIIERISTRFKENTLTLYGKNFSSEPIPGCFNIWFTAENIRPPLTRKFDYYLSFDLDDYQFKNSYLPLWICRLGPTLDLANEAQERLIRPRTVGSLRSKNFCAVISNPEQIRSYFISKLSNFTTVDIFGKMGLPIANKHQTLQDYNFNICFENDLYPGYVTEKAIESYLSGCIPIWRGLDPAGYLNQEAIIDVTNLSIEDGVKKVLEIASNKDKIQQMMSLPILNKTIDLSEIVANLRKAHHI